MKIHMEMNEEQARVLKEALELYGRIGMGQVQEINQHPSLLTRDFEDEKVAGLLNEVKSIVFPDLQAHGHYYGIRNPETHEDSRVAFDLQQVLRNRIAWTKNPSGGLGSVVFDDPIQYSQQPLPTCTVSEMSNPSVDNTLSTDF